MLCYLIQGFQNLEVNAIAILAVLHLHISEVPVSGRRGEGPGALQGPGDDLQPVGLGRLGVVGGLEFAVDGVQELENGRRDDVDTLSDERGGRRAHDDKSKPEGENRTLDKWWNVKRN